MTVAAFVISCVALVVAIVSAFFTSRNARANERRLRGESDAPRSTRFELEILDTHRFMPTPYSPADYMMVATNAGGAGAHDVKLVVTAKDTAEVWPANDDIVAPGQTIDIHLGAIGDGRLLDVEVSWQDDGRRRRQKHSRTMKTERA